MCSLSSHCHESQHLVTRIKATCLARLLFVRHPGKQATSQNTKPLCLLLNAEIQGCGMIAPSSTHHDMTFDDACKPMECGISCWATLPNMLDTLDTTQSKSTWFREEIRVQSSWLENMRRPKMFWRQKTMLRRPKFCWASKRLWRQQK